MLSNTFLIVCFIVLTIMMTSESIAAIDSNGKPSITPKIYGSIFVRRREEHKIFVKHLLSADYEKTYKMLDIAYDKILEIIKENNMTLHQTGYEPTSGFPTESRLQDSVALIIENTCLGSDLILHFPEISYRILRKHPNWKKTFDWGTNFLNNYAHILTEQTFEVVQLFRQEVNLTKRSSDFVNPYYKTFSAEESKFSSKSDRKKRKKLKRGPQLSGRTEL